MIIIQLIIPQYMQYLKSNNLFYSIPKIYLNEIYLERRNKIKEIISNYSNKYDFDLIGYNYDFSKEFDIYLKKYYMYYELNNTYNYFELLQDNSDIYIAQLSKNMSELKNLTETLYNFIFENSLNI